jgi:hypothetical protein
MFAFGCTERMNGARVEGAKKPVRLVRASGTSHLSPSMAKLTEIGDRAPFPRCTYVAVALSARD